MNALDFSSKFLGGMLGSALGDAIGELAFSNPSEKSLRAIIEKTDLLQYTDDTAMALGIAESLGERGTLNPHHLGETFRKNFEQEPWRGYGPGPPTVFTLVRQGYSYQEAAQRLFGGEGSFGNGSAMRITPLGLFFYNSKDLYEQAAQS
ncbi:MAG: ADP-ribosylglycohydrolase family protein, partial [Candidatus Heimdallarchaeota archaeon]